MTRFIRQIITVAAVAVISCDLDACVDAESNEFIASRGNESDNGPQLVRLRKRKNRRKLSTKSTKVSDSNVSRTTGSNTESGKSSKKTSSISGRIIEPDRKEHLVEERDPEEDLNEIIDNIRAIVPEKKPTIGLPVNDIATGTNEEEVSQEEVESSNFDTTDESNLPFLIKVKESEDETIDEAFSNSNTEPSEESTAEETESGNDIVESPNFDTTEESDLPFLVKIKESEDDPIDEPSPDANVEPNQDFDFSVVKIEDTGHTEEEIQTITIQIPNNEQTESPTESNSENISEAVVVETSPRFEKETRTVQIVRPENENECMAYDFTRDEMAIYMAECSTSEIAIARTWTQTKSDHWEILQINGSETNFQLRHRSTRLCIPANPDQPGYPFDCIHYFGMGDAIADSFTGLVSCMSPYAAVFEMDSVANSLYMSNAGCQDESFVDPVPVLMTYNKEPLTGGRDTVVWGGRILMELQDRLDDFNFKSEWKFVDV